MTRSNATGIVVRNTISEDFAHFDRLPPELRDVLRLGPSKASAQEVAQIWQDMRHRWDAGQVAAMIRRVMSRNIKAEYHRAGLPAP